MKMTREERELRKLILTAGCFYHHPERHPEIMKAIGAMRRAVIAQDRERCARVVEGFLDWYRYDQHVDGTVVAITDAIRGGTK